MEDDHISDLEDVIIEEEAGEISLKLEENSDLCEKLMEGYSESKIHHHQLVCASASAIRTLLKEEGKPLTPLSYLDATISAISDTISSQSTPIDPKSTTSLTSFLSILLPLVPSQSLPSSKANDIVTLLVSLFETPQSFVTIINVIKLLGFLIELCDLEDLKCTKSVFKMVLEFSIDKRRRLVRDCAQRYIVKMYNKSVQCVSFLDDASELFYAMFYKYLPYAIAISWSRIEITEDSEQAEELMLMESVHMLTVLKLIVEYLSNGVVLKVIDHIHMVMGCKFSVLSRPVLTLLEVIFESPRAEEIVVPKTEIIIFALGNYVSPKEKNPDDTISVALVLLKKCVEKLYTDRRSFIPLVDIPLVLANVAGVAGSGVGVSGEAAGILKELIAITGCSPP